METSTQPKQRRKRQLHHDRIVLDDKSMKLVIEMQDQIKDSFNDMVKIDTRKLVNFLIQSRSQSLNHTELKSLREQHFDQVKALEWALNQAKEAKSNGVEVSLHEILKKLETPLVSEKQMRKRPNTDQRLKEPSPLPLSEKTTEKP